MEAEKEPPEKELTAYLEIGIMEQLQKKYFLELFHYAYFKRFASDLQVKKYKSSELLGFLPSNHVSLSPGYLPLPIIMGNQLLYLKKHWYR